MLTEKQKLKIKKAIGSSTTSRTKKKFLYERIIEICKKDTP